MRIGGAIPRDSDRSSARASRAWLSASSTVSRAAVRVGVELLLGPAEVDREPDQPLLRAVVDVALEPAQRGRLGRHRGRGLGPGGGLALGQVGDLVAQRGHLDQQPAGEPRLEQRAARAPRTAG